MKCGYPAMWNSQNNRYLCSNLKCDWWAVKSQGKINSDRIFKKRYFPLIIILSILTLGLFSLNTQLYIKTEQLKNKINQIKKNEIKLKESFDSLYVKQLKIRRIAISTYRLVDTLYKSDLVGMTTKEIDSIIIKKYNLK